MPFLSDTQLKILQLNGSEANHGKDDYPVVKLFLPDATAIWLISELAADNDTAFGLCDLGHDHPELGYVKLSALDSLRGPMGLGVECDEMFDGNYPLSVYAQAAYPNKSVFPSFSGGNEKRFSASPNSCP